MYTIAELNRCSVGVNGYENTLKRVNRNKWRCLESITINLASLPHRHDLLARFSITGRNRLLTKAGFVA